MPNVHTQKNTSLHSLCIHMYRHLCDCCACAASLKS